MERRHFVQTLLAGAAGAVAAPLGAAESGKEQITAEITAVLRATEAIWDSQDTARLRELWDIDDAEPFYLAGEQDDWFVGWDEFNAYLAPPRGAPKITQAIRVRFYDIRARLLAPDIAFAAYWMRTDMKLVFQPNPFGSDNRVASVFRKKRDGWKYVCYTEAFQAPTMYFQKLFEKDVSPDYHEFYNQIMKKPG
jgi:SnoaL-like domain